MTKVILPLSNRVFIKRLQSKTSKGGILLPGSAQEKPKQGEVLAVGPGRLNEDGTVQPMCVKTGDIVLFSSYAGMEVQMDEKDSEYLILSEEEIFGVLV